MCDYLGYEFGAGTYPDSVCVEGKLYDADNCDNRGALYEPTEDIPCPICRPEDAVLYWAEYYSLIEPIDSDSLKAAFSLIVDIRKNRGLHSDGLEDAIRARSGK